MARIALDAEKIARRMSGFSSVVTLTAYWILPENSSFTRAMHACISLSLLWLHSAMRLASRPRT